MRLTTVILIATFMQVSASTFGQRITIKEHNITLSEVLKKIRKQSGYDIYYDFDKIARNHKISITVENATVEDAITSAITGLNFEYTVEGTIVTIRKKDESLLERMVRRFRSIDITGKITGENGLPLSGASVTVKGSGKMTNTDQNGMFSLYGVDENSVLVISYIGYLSREVKATRTFDNISLVMENSQLDDVVVTGFGQSQKKRDITGAVSSIGAKELENLPIAGFDRAMQGKLAGVRVTTNSGVPGSPVSVLIRGVGSFSGSTAPLYIVDGIQVNTGSLTINNSFATLNNVLNNINPDDIESIDVLKDASSASIYGALAANGVVIITTKKGKNGKTQFDFGSYFGYAEATNKTEVLNGPQWLTAFTESYINRYGASSSQVAGIRATYGADPADAPTYNWFDAAYRKGQTQNYQLTARGGTDKTKFYVSAGVFNQKGQQIAQDFRRRTFKVNLEQIVTDRISFETNINLSTFTQNGTSPGSYFTNPTFGANWIIPTNPVYTATGDFNEPLVGTVSNNPLKSAAYDINKAVTNQLQGIFALNYKILKDLKFRATASIDYGDIKGQEYWDPRTSGGAAYLGLFAASDIEFKNIQTNGTLNYSHLFNAKHKLSALAGFEYRDQINETLTTTKSNFPNYLFRTINAGGTLLSTASSFTEFKAAGYFARAEYAFDDKYIINGTVRYDGNSRFGANNKFGLFSSGSLTWRLSGEEFMKNISWLSDWKIRAGYGKVGNAGIGNFASLSLYRSTAGYAGVVGLAPGGIANNDLTWEDSYTFNLGTDVSLFQSRLSFTAEYYNRLNKNLLLNRTLPNTTGYTSIADNAGEMRNRGAEFQVNGNILTGSLKWNASFNISYNKNKVLKLITDDADPRFQLVGNSYTRILSYRYAGVNPADGRPMWFDQNNNLTYSLTSSDRAIIGDTEQKYFGGLTNGFSYKGVGLDVFLQFATGFMLLDQNRVFMDTYSYAANMTTDVLRRWTTPGQITDQPRAYAGGSETAAAYATISNQWYKPADYVRLKEVKLYYDFPKSLVSRMHLSNVKLYLTGTNLAVLTKYTGLDPETSVSDNGSVPQARTYTLGFQVGF